MTIQEYFGDWCKVIDVVEAERISRSIIDSKKTICPLPRDIFKAFRLCSFSDLKVVILGQDPYPDLRNGKPTATGIAFGNSTDTLENHYSPSLGVLKESVIDFSLPHGSITFDPSLEMWEAQGVLMLNSALSCIAGKPGSQALLWRPFIKSLLLNLSAITTGIVYVLMGTEAQSFKDCIGQCTNHIFQTRHPSWYVRNHTPMPSSLWYDINNILKGIYGHGIEWYIEN